MSDVTIKAPPAVGGATNPIGDDGKKKCLRT